MPTPFLPLTITPYGGGITAHVGRAITLDSAAILCTTNPQGIEPYTMTGTSLPTGVTIPTDGTTVPLHHIHLDMPAVGEFFMTVHLEHGSDENDLTIPIHVLEASSGEIDAPEIVTGWVGADLLAMAFYSGDCEAKQWYLSDAPDGVETAALAACGGPYAEDTHAVVALTGKPTAPGIYDAQLSLQVCCDETPDIVRTTVRMIISGGIFLGWLNSDPTIRDLQVMMYSREVLSYAFAGGVWFTLGYHARVRVVFRNGPLPRGLPKVVVNAEAGTTTTQESEVNYGRDIIDAGEFDELWLTLRQKTGDAEELVLLEKGAATALPTETIEGHVVFLIEFDVTSDALQGAMERVARAGDPQAVNSLACLGAISWVRDGERESSLNFDVTILRPVRRV